MIAKLFRFDAVLQQQGWLKPGFLGIDDRGNIAHISDSAPEYSGPIEVCEGYLLPGIPNGHSHAFQYAMAGLAEKHIPGSSDDFWSWREKMYECALSMTPEVMEAVATRLYVEMLRRGYTHVVEFHYLHHDQTGKKYSNLAEMGERIIAAATNAGIRLTLVPVLYQNGGFGKEPTIRQRRFLSSGPDEYFFLLDATIAAAKRSRDVKVGFGVHSLRAVDADDIIQTFESGPKGIPFHLHASEQLKEVEDCVAYLGKRPVEWILENLPVKDRFNLVHCTHLNDYELQHLAQSGANVVLCPGTEGNLGDGIFRLSEYAHHYGNWCIGTDSHITLNPFEDIRWLDYGQRLTTHKRNTFDDGASVLIGKLVSCGRKAAGVVSNNFFEVGAPLDGVVMGRLPWVPAEHILPTLLYSNASDDKRGTLIGGKWITKDGVHQNETSIRTQFSKAMRKLMRL